MCAACAAYAQYAKQSTTAAATAIQQQFALIILCTTRQPHVATCNECGSAKLHNEKCRDMCRLCQFLPLPHATRRSCHWTALNPLSACDVGELYVKTQRESLGRLYGIEGELDG